MLAVSQLLIKKHLLITCCVLGTRAGSIQGVQTKLEMRFPPSKKRHTHTHKMTITNQCIITHKMVWDNLYSKIQGDQVLCIHPIREGCLGEAKGELQVAGGIWKGREEGGRSWPEAKLPAGRFFSLLCNWGSGLIFQCGGANIWSYREN